MLLNPLNLLLRNGGAFVVKLSPSICLIKEFDLELLQILWEPSDYLSLESLAL